jgi:hypothetical protein
MSDRGRLGPVHFRAAELQRIGSPLDYYESELRRLQGSTATLTHPLPCPPWCDHDEYDDEYPVHHSASRVWKSPHVDNYAPSVEVSFYRGDEVNEVGMTDMDLRIVGATPYTGVVKDGNPALVGSFTANDARSLARALVAWADEIDPHRTNGVPRQEAT